MILDFKSEGVALLVEVPAECTVALAADVLDRARKRARENEAILDGLGSAATLQELERRVGAAESQHGVTLWWAKKPLDRALCLGDKFGKHERTKVAVSIGPLDPNAKVEVPVLSAVSSTAHPERKSVDPVPADFVEKTKALRRGSIPENSLKRLRESKAAITTSIRATILQVLASPDPDTALKQVLNKDRTFRGFADQLLGLINADDAD